MCVCEKSSRNKVGAARKILDSIIQFSVSLCLFHGDMFSCLYDISNEGMSMKNHKIHRVLHFIKSLYTEDISIFLNINSSINSYVVKALGLDKFSRTLILAIQM